jgi:tetratricopeptide (TPR) repeat protein
MKRAALAAAVLIPCTLPLAAQEVRRALPVDAVQPSPTPVGEMEVRRALPADAPAPTPLPTSTPVPTPIPESTPQPPAENPEPGGIRLAPPVAQGAADSPLERANGFYARDMHELAIAEYEIFLSANGTQVGRDAALFRLAESHRSTGNAAAARTGYEKLLAEFQTGEFAASAAYRLGTLEFGDKKYEQAAERFELAAREAPDPGVRLAAFYFAARSHEAAGNTIEAEKDYEKVLEDKKDNPYRDNAAASLANIRLKAGSRKAALEVLEDLVQRAATPDVSASAALQAAAVAKDIGQTQKALGFFSKATESSDPAVRSDARLGALRLLYEKGDFADVVKAAPEAEKDAPAAAKAEILQLVAASERGLGNEAAARVAYDRLIAEHPQANTPEVRYQRLLSLYAAKDKDLPAEADAFVQSVSDPRQKASAMLLKAEALFQSGDHAAAAVAYAPLADNESLKPEQRTAALYKRAWSLAASGDHTGAIAAYSQFAEKHRTDKLAASAVLQRGLSRLQSGDTQGALADFDLVISAYPLSKEVEIAMLQKALASGQLKDYAGMTATFRQLLKKYPNTAAAAQANYWLGWSAYEEGDFKKAIPLLETARTLDAKNYGERSALRIILAHYNLQDRKAASREAEKYSGPPLPSEVALWLAQGHLESGDAAKAESLLQPVVANPETTPNAAWLVHAEANLALGKNAEAAASAERFLSKASEPAPRARGYLAKARAALATNDTAAARAAAEQAILFQPEGRLNAEARMVAAEVSFAEGDHESAARAFMAVSVLSDDPATTPRALSRAAEAYTLAGRDKEAAEARRELESRQSGN